MRWEAKYSYCASDLCLFVVSMYLLSISTPLIYHCAILMDTHMNTICISKIYIIMCFLAKVWFYIYIFNFSTGNFYNDISWIGTLFLYRNGEPMFSELSWFCKQIPYFHSCNVTIAGKFQLLKLFTWAWGLELGETVIVMFQCDIQFTVIIYIWLNCAHFPMKCQAWQQFPFDWFVDCP